MTIMTGIFIDTFDTKIFTFKNVHFISPQIGLQTSFGSKAVATPTDYKIGAVSYSNIHVL